MKSMGYGMGNPHKWHKNQENRAMEGFIKTTCYRLRHGKWNRYENESVSASYGIIEDRAKGLL